MPDRDPRVDAYIDRAAPFAQPILRHLRDVVHAACPEVEETIKWGIPHFDYRGMMCSMAAFKAHCAFGFWKPELVLGSAARAAPWASSAPSRRWTTSPRRTCCGRREYVEWITEAKREATRARRIAQAVEWLAEVKPRNWKYR